MIDAAESKESHCGLDLQARGMNLTRHGKWKGTLDCEIVSRGPGVAQVEWGRIVMIFY